MDGGIDWLMLAITVPLVPAMAIAGALFLLRTTRPKVDDSGVTTDDPAALYLPADSEPRPGDGRDGQERSNVGR
jgi:hypothetical protein